MSTIRTFKPLALAALLALGTAPAAWAQADEAMLARFKSFVAEQGVAIDWKGVNSYENEEGDEVTSLTDVTISGDGETVPVPQLDLAGVEETDDGWRIGKLSVPSMTVTEDDSEAWLYDINVEDLFLPAADATEEDGAIPSYSSASMREMQVRVKGKDVFSMSDLHIEVTQDEDGGPMEFSGAAESFHVALDGIEDAQTRAMAASLGYEALDGYLEMEGSWNPADGQLSLARYDISIDNAGTFGISFELGGYTPELFAAIRKVQAQTNEAGGDDSAAGMAMLGLMQQMTFKSARIEFTDDSLTSRALEFVAQQQGAKASDVANQAKALVPFALMQINNPELTQMATQAVSAFLDDPQNFAIVAQPPAPVPFAMIAAGAMGAPQALPQQLGVKVVANE